MTFAGSFLVAAQLYRQSFRSTRIRTRKCIRISAQTTTKTIRGFVYSAGDCYKSPVDNSFTDDGPCYSLKRNLLGRG